MSPIPRRSSIRDTSPDIRWRRSTGGVDLVLVSDGAVFWGKLIIPGSDGMPIRYAVFGPEENGDVAVQRMDTVFATVTAMQEAGFRMRPLLQAV